MAHHVYTTPGFIVHSMPQGEANKYLLIFTRELGMIGATVQGVRLSQSKLRYYTQDFSRGLFSVVRGKEVWRMVGAKEVNENNDEMDAENKKLFVRVLSLLKRLLHGEEKNEKLFDVVESLYRYLFHNLGEAKRELVEYLTVFRILNCLGYIHPRGVLDTLCTSTEIDEEILEILRLNKSMVLREVNDGLKESQL